MGKQLWLVILLAANASAASWRPTDRMLHAVRCVESAEGTLTWGDHGRSLGDFQLSEAAWVDVSGWRKTRGLPIYGYEVHVWNQKISRMYAADYLGILHRELQKHLNRKPTEAEVYAAYNMGLGSFAQCQYQLAKVNPVTARRCEQLKAMVRQK